MCKRNTTDPLVRRFLDTYKVNLLAVPRRDARCGQVYLRQGRRVSSGVDVTALLVAPVELPPPYEGEPLADLSGSLSNRVSLDAGLGVLRGFLAAIGVGAVIGSLSAGYERSRAANLRFRFTQVTRDSIEPGSLGAALEGRRLRESHALVTPGTEYFITAAVVRSPSISVVAEDRQARSVELGAEALEAVKATGAVGRESGSDGELTFHSTVPLAIGLELYELRFEPGTVSMLPQNLRDAVKAGRDVPPPPHAFVAADDEALLEVTEEPHRGARI